MPSFNLNSSMANGIAVLNVQGSVDAHVAPQFDKGLKDLLSQTKKIIVELSGLDYIATAGLGVLMAAFNEAHSKGGNVIICGITDKIRKVFDTMGFSKVLKLSATLDEAKKAF